MSFKALIVEKPEDGALITTLKTLNDDILKNGDVAVSVEWSSVNYKDGLAMTGAAPIIQSFPLIPGIDLAGTVIASGSADHRVGDRVVVNGWEMSQSHHGGLAQRARVPGEWLVRLPDAISTRDAMAIGTAGYTAMLCVLALEYGGVGPSRGGVLVTGVSGGVGSIATVILAKLGYRVVVSTGRPEEEDYLRALGAAEIINRASLSAAAGSVGPERWAGAVDTVGSHTLVNVLAQTAYRGVVAACGLAQGIDLPGTVLPFILRSVTLAGIDSVNAPQDLRQLAWTRLADDLDLGKLATTITEVELAQAPEVARAVLQGKVRGRTVVNVNR
ncbi:MAG: MDR family oxidoreductase [Roseiarcus sp.]